MNKKLISIVSGTFNEAENVVQLYERVLASLACYNGIYPVPPDLSFHKDALNNT